MARAVVVLVLLLAGCSRPEPDLPAFAPEPVEAAGLHNVFRLTPTLLSGSTPEGDAGFRSLVALGVRTVVTVDGAAPDVATAKRFGLRYVHLPVGYDGVPAERAAALAAAVRDLPGPVYVHCHHGKHRGPAAAVAAARCLDARCSAAAAVEFLTRAGTDPRYPGLYAAAERPPTAPAAGELPEVAAVPDLVRLMVDVDERWDRLKAAAAAGWPDRPVAAADAVVLGEHYREAARLAADRGDEFRTLLGRAEAAAGELEAAVRAGRDAGPAVRASAATCTACHAKFRDTR
jgi:protein tyrosine phosphatase (PTP) superfamily phosphohydrolase (DUF442 family)